MCFKIRPTVLQNSKSDFIIVLIFRPEFTRFFFLFVEVGRAQRTSFLGGSDAEVEDSWIWEDGTPWGYTFWGQDEPNGGTSENCLLLDMDEGTQIRGRWIDVACEGRTGRDEGYICSYVNGRSYAVIVNGGIMSRVRGERDGMRDTSAHKSTVGHIW